MVSVGDAKPWTIDRERRPYGLRVVLPKHTYVLPWAQFLYAEGAPDSVRALRDGRLTCKAWVCVLRTQERVCGGDQPAMT